MKPTQELHELGQSLWLDYISRTILDDGTLAGYIEDLSLTGLTSNPTIFDKAIGSGSAYDEQIAELRERGLEGEDLFFELALTDLKRAAKLFEPVNTRTDDVDGWVSLEVSPLLADDTEATIAQARDLHEKAEDSNVFIKIPGTEAGHGAIAESIFAGIPINVTLLFSTDDYLRAADAFMEASSAGSRPASIPPSLRLRPFSSAAGTSRSPTRRLTSCATDSGSRSVSRPTGPIGS